MRSDATALGIGLSCLSFAILSGADALTKLLSSSYSIFELAAIDTLFAILVVVPIMVRVGGLASLRPRRPALVLARSAFAGGSLLAAFLSFTRLPLADAYAVAFISPLAVTALSVPVTGERVGWRQWTAVAIGFAAVLGILRPTFDSVQIGQLIMFGSALLFALSLLMLRRIAPVESSGTLILCYLAVTCLMSLAVAIPQWHNPTAHDLALIFVMGLSTGFGNLALIYASRMISAAINSSFMYTQLLWGAAFGFLLFGDVPDAITLAGAAVIVVCGLYTLWHATGAQRAPAG